ncbi:MAG TPA: mechanosensitive ion channel domain-containing protein [Candidatus Baltobacteraceae bacterium]|nr:mechanosensitive ion channel domain-containing protein [Candidatus Baltobacteraceae bacterium]
MLDHITIIALGVVAAGALAGVGAESLVRRVRALASLRSIAFIFFLILGLYVAALMLQRGHVDPNTHRVFVAILIIFATVVIARGAASVVSRKSAAAASAIGSISLFINVTETLVAIVGGLVVMQYLGISVAPILTAFGIGGLAVALALQDTLANFFSGIQIAASRQVHAGDLVRIDADNTGTVVDINWRNTVLRDADGNRIIVPNQKLAQAIFTAYRRPLRVPITVTLDRSADFGRISDAARQTASEVANPLPKDEIEVRFGRVADRSVDMVVTVPARDASDRRRIGSEFATAFLKRVATEDPKGEKIKAVAP